MIIVQNKDLKALHDICQKHGLAYYGKKILSNESKTNSEMSLSGVVSFTLPVLLSNIKIQNDFVDYFKKEKNVNLIEFYEQELYKHTWRGDLFNLYARFVKNGKYYPKNDQNFLNALVNQQASNNKVFESMCSLASVCKDNLIAVKLFYLILTKKKPATELSLLVLEKIQKLWDKRFKGIDIATIAPEESDFFNSLFNKVKESKTRDFFEKQDGYFIKIDIDTDILSQANKLSINKNQDALSKFFNAFSNYVQNSEESKEILSISNFKKEPYETSSLSIEFQYQDPSKKEVIYALACDLIDYATAKHDKNNLRGADIYSVGDIAKFFSSFVMNYTLKNSLGNKESNVKKNKI